MVSLIVISCRKGRGGMNNELGKAWKEGRA